MRMFERKPEQMVPLKFKVGEKIMGLSTGLDFDMMVGGTIIEAQQSKSFLTDNQYLVQLEPSLTSVELMKRARDKGDFWIDEKKARPFDEVRFTKAFLHFLDELRLFAKAHEEHVEMLRELYSENYTDKQQ